MSEAGLQVWDASGSIIFDSTSRVPRILGQFTFPTGTDSGVITDSRLALVASGKAKFFYVLLTTAGTAVLNLSPTVSYNGSTGISWSWPSASRAPHNLIYGLYN